MNLNFKYLIIISTALFLLFAGIAFIMVYQNAELMNEIINNDFNQQQLIIARQIATQIDNIIRDIHIEIESLKHLDIGRKRDIRRKEIEAFFIRNVHKGLLETGIADSENRVVEAYSGIGPAQNAGTLLPQSFERSDSVFLTNPEVVSLPDGSSTVRVFIYSSVQLPDATDGTLYVQLDVTSMISGIAHSITSGKTGYSWVIDETGTFLYHPEREFIGRDAFTARSERRPLISFSSINRIMKDKMLRGEEGTGTYTSGWHRGIEGEITKLIAFTPIKSTLSRRGHIWSVAVAAPISEVAEVVHTIYIRHYTTELLLLISIFIFGILAVIYHVRMSRALRERVKQTEADLHQKERIYRKIFDRATDLIYMFDLQERIILLNKHSVEVFSELVYFREEDISGSEFAPGDMEWYINRPIDRIFNREDVLFVRMHIERVLQNKTSATYRHKVKIRGRYIYLNTKLIPITDDNNEIYQILGISRDVTERMELDHRMYNMEKLASIGTLAAGVAHEINNPLAIILGFTDLLTERFSEDSPERKDLDMIVEQGNIAKQVVENLLGFARVTEGLEDIVDIDRSLDMVVSVVRNTLKTNDIELEKKIPCSLPKVRCDTREFQQVIFNLINNAIAAMKETGGTITLSAEEENRTVKIHVEDTGSGIPDDIKQYIFDPFFTTKKAGEGTGLGLSLCYGIVRKYDGNIQFRSVSATDEPNRKSGSVFTVIFQIAEPGDDAHTEAIDETTHSGR